MAQEVTAPRTIPIDGSMWYVFEDGTVSFRRILPGGLDQERRVITAQGFVLQTPIELVEIALKLRNGQLASGEMPRIPDEHIQTAREVWNCATSWEPDVRLLGNVKASRIEAMCKWLACDAGSIIEKDNGLFRIKLLAFFFKKPPSLVKDAYIKNLESYADELLAAIGIGTGE